MKVMAMAEVRIAAVLPAHNEEGTIGAAIGSLRAQSRMVDDILVVSDNSTDATATVAEATGARVFETVGNAHKKAGALNQALVGLLVELDDDDLVMVMDADSEISASFVQVAVETLARRRSVGAVGGVFYGMAGAGLVG